MNPSVLVGVSGGIAGYKAIELIKILLKDNIDVNVILTESANAMFGAEFNKLKNIKLHLNLFNKDFNYRKIINDKKVLHINLADISSVVVVYPATANIISKIANGIADDFLTTTVLASNSPVIICPSMNTNMLNNPMTQDNLKKIKKSGMIVLDSGIGDLACGYRGKGRLVEKEKVIEEIYNQISYSKSLLNKKILVTAGPTIEKIDDVRYISNISSGKMGCAIADECYLRGADVTLLRSINSVDPRYLYRQEIFESFDDLKRLILRYSKKTNIIFHLAAVGDFKINKKIGKIDSSKSFLEKFIPQIKISDEIKKINPNIFLVLFKAEIKNSYKEFIEEGEKKMISSRADVVVMNDISNKKIAFGSEFNEVYLITKIKKIKKLKLNRKQEIAKGIVDAIDSIINNS